MRNYDYDDVDDDYPRVTVKKKKPVNKRKFTYKKEPQKPARLKFDFEDDFIFEEGGKHGNGVWLEVSLDQVMKHLESNGVDFKKCKISENGYLHYETLEADKDFEKRIQDYKKKKEIWDKWASENKEEIENYKRLSEEAKFKKAKSKVASLLAKKQKAEKAFQKEQEKLDKLKSNLS